MYSVRIYDEYYETDDIGRLLMGLYEQKKIDWKTFEVCRSMFKMGGTKAVKEGIVIYEVVVPGH